MITGPRRVKTAFPKSGHTDDVLFSKPGYNCKGKREGQLSNDDIPIKGVSEIDHADTQYCLLSQSDATFFQKRHLLMFAF